MQARAQLTMGMAACLALASCDADQHVSGPAAVSVDRQLDDWPSNAGLLIFCRLFSTGTQSKLVAGSTWQGACPNPVTVTPAQFFGPSQTQPITLRWGTPVAYISIGFREFPQAEVPGTEFAVFDPDGRQIAGGPMASVIHLHDVGPISRVVITPSAALPPADASGVSLMVLMDFAWDPNAPCPTLADSNLTRPGFLVHMVELANLAGADHDRREYKGLIWRETDGSISYQHLPSQYYDPNDWSECSVTWFLPPDDGRVLVGISHAHGRRVGEFTPCEGGGRYLPGKHGGGSVADWNVLAKIEALRGWRVPSYVIDLDLSIFRLDPGVDSTQRSSNRNMWKRASNGCYERFRQ